MYLYSNYLYLSLVKDKRKSKCCCCTCLCLFIGCSLSNLACHCLMLFQDDEGKFKGLWNGNSSVEIFFEVAAAADIDSDGINFWKGNSGPEQLHKQTNLSPRAQLSALLFLLLLIIIKKKSSLQTATTAASVPVFLDLFFFMAAFSHLS